MKSTLSREDLQRANPLVPPARVQRWSVLPSGCRPLQADERVRRGDIMRLADGWYEEYAGFNLVGFRPGPPSRIYAATWYRWEGVDQDD